MTAQMFHYAARSHDGKEIRGSIEAEDRASAIVHLRGRSLFVSDVSPAASARGAVASLLAKLRRRTASRVVFFRAFAAMTGAGISVKRALDALIADDRDSQFAEVLRSVGADVADGSALSVAMKRHCSEFSPIAIATIAAGEVGGSLDRSLRSVAELEERSQALRKKVSSSLAYPVTVTLSAIALVAFLVANTMPAFASMFAQLHVPVPLSTRLLIAAGRTLSSPEFWLFAAALVVGLSIGGRKMLAGDGGAALTIDRLFLQVPLAGSIRRKTIVARFARTLGSLLRAGVELVAALEAATGVVDGVYFRSELRELVSALHQGEPLGARLEVTRLFDGIFLALVRAGEESGTLDAMLLRLAEYYESEVETSLAALSGILEPALMLALGAVVGTIVASIILPLYSLIGDIR